MVNGRLGSVALTCILVSLGLLVTATLRGGLLQPRPHVRWLTQVGDSSCQGRGFEAAQATTERQWQQQPLKIYAGVLSASSNRTARDAIRAGWATSPLLHRVRFFLARSSNDALFDEVGRL